MITDDSVSAEEKIKQLVEFEQDKRKEVEQKKKELEEKQKELAQLEEQGQQEIKNARKEIEEKIGELKTEEKQRFEELEELRIRREAESAASLEETVEQEERAGRIREVPAAQRGYNEVIEEIMQGNPDFYDITNYNVVNRLENIASNAVDRPLTASERTFIDNVHYHAERVRESYQESRGTESPYLKRELEQIDKINRMLREKEKPGEYHP